MERDYAPLSAACVRALNDKLYDKRKAAALEIEKMVKEFAAVNNSMQIRRLLKVLGHDFAMSKNPNTKKGGLIGLAALAVGLGKDTVNYIDDLIIPILVNFNDSDLKVRYYASESLYNVSKVARSAVLKHFAEIFKSLSKLATDPDQNVKNASELLDRLMKDIVTDNSSEFDLINFIPLLRERIYTDNTFAKQFIISWITILDDVPSIDLVAYLPEILDGLFKMLSDPTFEIKKMCDAVLKKFLGDLHQNPEKVKYTDMINTVVIYSYYTDEFVQYTAMCWIKEFIDIYGSKILPFTSSILKASLASNSNQDNESQIRIKQTAKLVNSTLLELINSVDDNIHNTEEVKQEGENLDLTSVITVLIKELGGPTIETKITVLKWIYHLFIHLPNRMLVHMESIFPLLLTTLSYPNEEVVQNDLKVIAKIISPSATQTNNKQYFDKFILSLLKQFCCDRTLLKDRGQFIIRQICGLLNSNDIYRSLSTFLLDEENMKFASVMIGTLNTILLTSPELYDLRTQLRDIEKQENREIFLCLFRPWCHNPVAAVALCLLTQNYFLVCKLLQTFASMDVTIDLLIEIDKLIQLLESPIFIYLRMELLDEPVNHYLIQALYGLLMIMPQSDAFHLLRHRLKCVPHLRIGLEKSGSVKVEKDLKDGVEGVFDTNSMLNHFTLLQEKHRNYRKNADSSSQLDKTIAKIDIQ
ncbi:Armadillo-type fold,Vacuolar protein 14 C-terminal Fig4-binding domain,HEAT, type 2,Armadillo-like [Cinara cedri]|uniref:Protein VAC14 homolog n=1 Tax=Cinara cedri TaxID=506608 RepID=A0A5E4N7H8_9HEMI|nr:Armadillo-type fold,Vacuolar protein 14 C-terminal Fig4-binding domain,HEAT, type 2,Armadillo-like [Cinara cedri]